MHQPLENQVYYSLKTNDRQFDNFVVTRGIISCRDAKLTVPPVTPMLPNWQSFVFSIVMTLQHWILIIVMMPTLSSQRLSLWQTPVPPVTTNLSSCQLSVFDDNIFPSWWSPRQCILTSSHEQIWNGHLNLYTHPQISNIKRTLVGNQIVDHSDVVGASPVGAVPSTSSLSI